MAENLESRQRFVYPDLEPECIRLLTLLPIGTDRTPRLEMVNNLPYAREEVKYTALSYCWGDPKDTVPAVVNGCFFAITRSLNEALLAITEHHNDCFGPYFWVDAICIDQKNDEEKAQQVSQMWRIFHSAMHVLAWIGPKDDTSEQVFTMLNSPSMWSTDVNLEKTKAALKPRAVAQANSMDQAWRLVARTYFSRVWMITECIQATSLVFVSGKHSCTPGSLWSWLRSRSDRDDLMIQARALTVRMSYTKTEQDETDLKKFAICIRAYSQAKCSDIRDRVYAMLGHPLIRRLDAQTRMKADYNLSTHELYIVTMSWINEICTIANYTAYPARACAEVCASNLMRGLNLPHSARWDLETFLASHKDWKWSPGSAQLILPNGREIDFSSPFFQHLIKCKGVQSRKGKEGVNF